MAVSCTERGEIDKGTKLGRKENQEFSFRQD
jgi:hypothetical protein